MSREREILVKWLRDAHAMERATTENLDRLQARFGRHPQLFTRMQQHWIESEEQAVRLEASLKLLGAKPSSTKDATSRLLGALEAYVTALAPDEVLKDCLAAYAFEHFEIASYLALVEAARLAGEPEIERTCDEHLQQERTMAAWLEQQIPELTRDYLSP
jgi:ferritin-like metal-binding protein YciE